MPASGLLPLRVGPEDVTAAEAGDLVKKVGVHNQAKALIQGTAKQMPKDLRVIIQRYEHQERTKLLDEKEVLAEAEGTVGDDTIERVLSARVKGPKGKPLESYVVVLYETDEGRTARCAIAYDKKNFPKSIRAFDSALASGEVEVGEDSSDAKSLRRQLDRANAEVKRLAEESGSDGPSEEEIEELVNAKAEEKLSETISEAGFETREDLIGALKQLTADNGSTEDEGGGPAPDEVEAPTGKSKELIAGVGDFSDAQLAALLEAEKAAKQPRSTVIDAVEAEQKKRADAGD